MSSSINYRLDAPCCGAQLTPYAGHPDGAPWVCAPCHRGFWVSELSHKARELYRPQLHDWGHGDETRALREEVLSERRIARTRGTSCLEEHIGQLTKDHLKQIQRLLLHKDFRKLIEKSV